MNTIMYKGLIVGLVSLIMLNACSSTNPHEAYANFTDEEIYTQAVEAMEAGKFSRAVEAYEQLEAQYPFGKFSEQGQLEIIYAYYRKDELPAAMAAADRFIRLHPRHRDIDYAYYMRGYIKFHEFGGFLERLFKIDRSKRDVLAARESYRYFSDLVRLYPDSQYSIDARQRMLFIRNALAVHELNIAQWYMRRGAYLAAANRANFIVSHFEGAPVVPKALAIMVDAYTKLELPDLARTSQQLLLDNYPAADN